MFPDRRSRRALLVAGCLLVGCPGATSYSWAQVGAFGGLTGPSLTAPPVTVQNTDPFVNPRRDHGALPVGGWLLYPSVFFGGLYDSNVNQGATNKVSSAGGRLVPSLLAENTDGIHKTTFYGMADGRAYTDNDAGSTVAARAGLIQRYQPLADLTFTAQGDYTRQKDLFSTFGIDHSVTTLNPTGVGLSPSVNPQPYNQYTGLVAVQKIFDRAFVNISGSAVDIIYDSTPTGTQSPNGVTYTGVGRGGFWFTPFFYAYAEGAADQRRYNTDMFNSHGYRTVGGIGTDQIGLFRGEVYGGYQEERFESATLGTVNGTVAGGRLYYYPLRELTIRGSVDESIGVSQLQPTPTAPIGTPTRVTSSLVQATYAFGPEWAAAARFGYIHTTYVGSPRLDDAWTGGATITYSLWLNWALALDYQHVELKSNVPLQSFTRDVVTLGATYTY
jgi:Putative beta-barrel porin 2